MRHWIHLGTQKAGSSFLRGLVAQVRHIGLADRQELNFFGFEENHSYEAYLARFPQQRPILFENSPIYFRQGSKCAAPFAETMGDKDPFLSIFLRDPVEAIVSHHNMQLLQGFFAGPHDYIGDPRDLRAFIRNNPHYLDRCRYMDLLERHWLTRFPRESFGICTFEEFTAEPVQVLRQLAPWAGLDDTPDIEPDGVPTNARPSSPLSHWLLEATNGGAMRALRRRAMASPALRQLAEATLFAKPKVHQADEDLRSLKAEIAESFRGDVVRLCEFLGRHSLPWKNFFDIDLAPTRGDSQPRQSVRATATRHQGKQARMPSRKTVMIFGSYAPSLLNFRGRLIGEMVGRGHRVVAVAPNIAPDVRSELTKIGAETRQVRLSNTTLNPIEMAVSLREVRKIIRDIRPAVVFGYTIKPVIVGAFAARAERVPRVVSFITGVGFAFTNGREVRRVVARVGAWVLYKLALTRSDKVVFQNPDDRELFRRLHLLQPSQDSYVVVSSGVDLKHFVPVSVPDKTSFLMMARLVRDKGLREFAEAAKRVKAEFPDVTIAIAGQFYPSPDSLTSAEFEQLIRCGVEYKGQIADVRRPLADCSVFVLPSYREGGPQSILEAMAMGRAIITTTVPGCRHRVDDGVHGLLVPPRDASALYEAMMEFVRDPSLAAAMGKRARGRAENEFDVHRVNADLLEISGL